MTYSFTHVDIKFDTEQIEKEVEKVRQALQTLKPYDGEDHIIKGEN